MLRSRLITPEVSHVGRRSQATIRHLTLTTNSLDSGAQEPTLEALTTEAANDTDANSGAQELTLEALTNYTEAIEAPPLQIDQEIQDFITKIEAINPQTVKDDILVEELLQESLELLHQRVQNCPGSASQLALIQSMRQLLNSWISMHVQLATRPWTNRPFQILIEAWRLTAPAEEAPRQAMAVLQRWYELLSGHLELAPVMKDFNQVLSTFSATCSHAVPAWHDSNADDNTLPFEIDVPDLASEAYDFVQEITATHRTETPTMETNAHLVKCLSSAIRAMVPINPDNVNRCSDLWMQLQTIMKDDVQPLSDNLFSTQKNRPSFFAGKERKLDNQELFFLLQALCDALTASRTISVANARLPARHFIPIMHAENEPDPKSEGGSVSLWHQWGSALMERMLEKPDRTAAISDFGTGRDRHNSASTVLSVFAELCKGCEAWQHLIHNDTRMEPASVAFQIQNVLEKLEALGQRYGLDGTQQLDVHVALLNQYLLAIKHWEYLKQNNDASNQQQEGALRYLEERHWSLVDQFVDQQEMSIVKPNTTLSEDELQAYSYEVSRKLTASFNHLMLAKFEVAQSDDVYRLFKAMQRLRLPLNRVSYSVVLKSLADSTTQNAAVNAHGIFKTMREKWLNNPGAPSPNGQHYASVLVAWSRSSHKNAAQRSLSVCSDLSSDHEVAMKRQDEGGSVDPSKLLPDNIHYAALFKTLAKQRGKEVQWGHEIMSSAQYMIENLSPERRNALACGFAITALKFVATKEAAELAQVLLDDLASQYALTEDQAMKPTAYHYASCMHAWARAATHRQATEAQSQIEEMLLQLEKKYEASEEDPDLLPNSVVYQALVNSITAFDTVDAGERAEKVLNRMEEKAARGLASFPGEQMYNRCIEAYRNSKQSDSGERANAILERMKNAYKDGIVDAKPGLYAYRAAIQAWATCPQPEKATHANRLFEEMKDIYHKEGNLSMKPDHWTCTALLKCCVYTPKGIDAKHQKEAVRIALQTIVAMEELNEEVTSFTYSLVLMACERHESNIHERTKLATVIFQLCSRDGRVDAKVLDALKKCAPNLHRNLPKELPDEWTQNAKK